MKRKPKFLVGQVVAYRRIQEVLFRYARIHSECGTIYDYSGVACQGWRLLDGNSYWSVPQEMMRPLTKRERGA
jgi:hypothetical protein